MNIIILIFILLHPNQEQGLFLLTKNERPIEWNECLAEVGRKKSKDMVERGYWSHEDPVTGENKTWSWIKECEDYKYAGENISKNFENSIEAHKALMDSLTHKKNIMESNFNKLGVGCYKNICTEIFTN